jgi:tetratricopeptide (TPR) repeat protein
MQKRLILSILCWTMCLGVVRSQTEPEDVAMAPDEFTDQFYESLKQKGIENYDKAIQSLEACLKMQPNNAAVYNELGRNYLLQKNYDKAYQSFDKASKLDPKNMWYVVGMYDVSYETRNYNQAINIVERLVEFRKEYREDLVSLYMNTQQHDKALDLINILNDEIGRTEQRDTYKALIMQDSRFMGPEKANLLEQIRKNPKEESNYIQLIYLYSESNQEEKAMEIAMKLEREIPESDWAQVSLFKFHINENEGKKASEAMTRVLKSNKIDNKIKHRVLNEFLIFAKDNPEYDADLQKALGLFNDKNVMARKEIGKFYHSKSDWKRAATYYELQLKSNPEDLETALLLLEVLSQSGDYKTMLEKASPFVESYPLQPEFYYYQGLALNQQKNFKAAREALSAGLDYVVENPELEMNFNIQLGEAYAGLGDSRKKEQHFKKAETLLQGLKKNK